MECQLASGSGFTWAISVGGHFSKISITIEETACYISPVSVETLVWNLILISSLVRSLSTRRTSMAASPGEPFSKRRWRSLYLWVCPLLISHVIHFLMEPSSFKVLNQHYRRLFCPALVACLCLLFSSCFRQMSRL